jgi:polysaccharide deacetylase 2 family uncharacterized protein YibQ
VSAVAIVAALVLGAVLAARLMTPPESRARPADRKSSPQRTPAVATAPRLPAKVPETKAADPPIAAHKSETEPTAPPKLQPSPPERPLIPETDAVDPNSLRAALPPGPPEPPAPKKQPRVAIIIDDVGYDRVQAEKFIALNAALTLAILPHSPHQQAIARSAHAQGAEIMLHLPMEPLEYPEINPGPGALLTSMSPDELLKALDENLQAVPYVKGVNNHMGSKLTSHSEQVYQVFSVLKRRGLYFVDSRTTDASVCQPSARLLQLPFAQRDVFLDHVQDPTFIRKQVRELVRIARHKGEALGIGHPYSTTYNVLREMLPELRQQIELVPASRLVRVIG